MLPEKPTAADGILRLLFIHAHPDDESITTGGTMAAFARSGAQVSLLTATRGELGEVIPEELRYLEQGLPKPGRPGQSVPDGGAGLALVRTAELNQAAAELGVRQRMFLGEWPALAPGAAPTAYRDSGMSWGPAGPDGVRRAQAAEPVDPAAFSAAPLDEVAGHAAALIRALRPDVVVSYAADGGYGHPDHVRSHQMTVRAVELAGQTADQANPAWDVPAGYAILSDRPADGQDPEAPVFWIDGDLTAKRAALQAHRTQVSVRDDEFALSDLRFRPLSAKEGFQLLHTGSGASEAARRPVRRTRSDWLGYALASIFAGVLAAVFGTMLHGRSSMLGAAQVPWGAALALILVAATVVLIGAWSRAPLLGMVTGAAAYAMCVIFSIPHGQVGLIISNLAGNLWLYGVAGVTVLYMLSSAVLATRSRAARERRNSGRRGART